MRALVIMFLILNFSLFLSAQTPCSEIPDRREFPVDPGVNPCQDFYQYACGKVSASFLLRDDRSKHTFSFNDASERILTKKKAYFKELTKLKPSSEHEEELKNFYLACMNLSTRKNDEHAEVRRIRALADKMKTRADFLNWIENSYLSPESAPLGWGPISNLDRPEINDLTVGANYLTLPEKTYYKKEDVLKELNAVLIQFFKNIGQKNPAARAQIVLDFEKGLAEVTPAPSEFRQIVNNRTFISRADLLGKFPNLRLDKLLAEVPTETVIRNWVPDALSYLNKYFAEAPLNSLQTLLLYYSLNSWMDDAYPEYYRAKFNFRKKHFGGPDKRPDRQERCTVSVMHTFYKELDSILMPRIFPGFPKEKFVTLAESVRLSILDSLKDNQWLSKTAKEEAISKIKTARLQLVAPNTESEWDFLPLAHYSNKAPINNEKTISMVRSKKALKELRTPNDLGRWDMAPLTVNAYYDSSYNKFVMPIGILQFPFYDPDQSIENNLGAVGSIIGHELGHSVDDQGARYDSMGKQRQWMTMDDLKNFSDRSGSLVAQYDGIGHNGRLTLGENIGDLVGASSSFRAASKDPDFLKSSVRQQGFFLSYARLWCNVTRPKAEEAQLKTDPHSLGFARVNEPLKHLPAFKTAFQCKDSDAMILPENKRVKIW